MATKDHLQLSLGQNDHVNYNSISNEKGQYSNLNLNANQTCPALETVQSESISSNSNQNHYLACNIVLDENSLHTNNKSFTWNKADSGYSNNLNHLITFGSTENGENKKRYSDEKKKASNSSTLSLHIAAYENAIEAPVGLNSAENDEIGSKQKSSNKTSKNVKNVKALNSSAMGCFEIPRQQSDVVTSKPEVAQFKASQKLLNPNMPIPPSTASGSFSVSTSSETAAPIKRNALGDVVSIGSLYNAPRGSFTTTSAYTSDINNYIITTPIGRNDYEYIFETSFNGKFEKLEVNADLALNILCGFVKVKGHGTYLNSSSSNGRKITYSVIYKRITMKEEINTNDEEIKSQICVDTIKNSKATHVNSGTYYGAYAMFYVTYEREENETEEEAKAKLKAAVKLIGKLDIQGGGQLNNREHDSKKYERFEVKAYYHGDLPNEETLPTSIEEADAFIKKVPSWVNASNGGKGVPFSYDLTPINYLPNTQKALEFDDRNFNDIGEDVIVSIFEVFDEMDESENYLTNLELDFNPVKEFLEDEVLQNIKSKKKKIKNMQLKLKCKIKALKPEVQGGQKSDYAFIEALDEYYDSELTYSKVKAFCRKYNPLKSKAEYIKDFKKNGVICVGKETTFMKHNLKIYYACYCNWADEVNRDKNLNLFLEMAKEKKSENSDVVSVSQNMAPSREKHFVFIDRQVNPDVRDENVPAGNRICEYVNDYLVDSDCLKTHTKDSSKCLVKCTVQRQFAAEKPNKRVNFYSPCPLSFQQQQHHCDSEECEWLCFDCRTRIQYGFDNNFYCECGFAHISNFVYRCSHPWHGASYYKHDEPRLFNFVGKIRVNNDMNILLLSEPGVDVDTWMIYYAASLTKCTEVEITKSETHGLPLQTFSYGRKTIRFIDISKVNRENDRMKIWDSITKFEELHGICILVKPDNSASSVRSKEYIMNGLLAFLPQSAAKNFVFCVTPSGDCSYRPGEILGPYIKELTRSSNIDVHFTPETVYYLGDDVDEFYEFPNSERRQWQRRAESQRFYNHFENDIKSFKTEKRYDESSIANYHIHCLANRSVDPLTAFSREVKAALDGGNGHTIDQGVCRLGIAAFNFLDKISKKK